MAWVQIMENVLSARPGPQPGCSTEDQQPVQAEESLVPDIDTFDFERYLYVLPWMVVMANELI